LHVCAEYGQEELFKYFLGEPNAKVNCKNYVEETPLHLAAREGKLNMLNLLIN
jgi:ankyrin repeat protein